MIGFKLGAREASPFVETDSCIVPGTACCGVESGGSRDCRFVRCHQARAHADMANHWYAALIVWNLTMILAAGRGVK